MPLLELQLWKPDEQKFDEEGISMQIRIENRYLEDVVVLVPDIFQDSRDYKEVIKGKNPEQNIKLQLRDTIGVP